MTKIEWTDETWNPVVGCSVASPGCTNCYAMKLAARIERMSPGLEHYRELTQPSKAGPVWTGKIALAPDDVIAKPLHWKRPRMIFVCSMGDLFHESVPDSWIDRVFAVMALSPQHTFQVLTKRASRMRNYFDDTRRNRIVDAHGDMGIPFFDWPLPNVWLGVSAERQQEADARIPDLLATPAAVRFVSAEPLLGPVDFTRLDHDGDTLNALSSKPGMIAHFTPRARTRLDWMIVGGESGSGARPMHPDWARAIRDQCQAAGVPFFFKQWGEWAPVFDRDRDDPDWRADYSQNLAERSDRRWLNIDGGRGFHGERFHVMSRVGKRAAGRGLDGHTWGEMPAGTSTISATCATCS